MADNQYHPVSNNEEFTGLVPPETIQLHDVALKHPKSTTVYVEASSPEEPAHLLHGEDDSLRTPHDPAEADGKATKQIRPWSVEIICCLVAIASMGAIVGLLDFVDDQPLTAWTHRFSLTTAISILILSIKTTLAVPIMQTLAQLKWSRFDGQSRPFPEFDLIAQASVGILGCFKLLLRIPTYYLATIAALLFLMLQGAGPIIQQSVEIHTRGVDSTNRTSDIPVFNSDLYPEDYLFGNADGKENASENGTAAIYGGIFQIASNKSIIPNCASGTCHYELYQSLGMCSECVDVTDHLTMISKSNGAIVTQEFCSATATKSNRTASDGCIYRLPNGLEGYGPQYTSLNVSTGLTTFEPSINNISGVLNLTAILSTGTNKLAMMAYQCSLYYCPIRYNATFINGNFIEDATPMPAKTSWTTEGMNTSIGPWDALSGYTTVVPDACVRNNKDSSKCSYQIPKVNGRALEHTIGQLLTGAVTCINGGPGCWYSSYAMVMMESHNPAAVLKSTALMLTNYIRTSPLLSTDSISGMVVLDESYYRVKWSLLAYPFTVIGLSLLHLVVVIWRTRGQSIWKDSTTANMMAGQELGLRGPDIGTMEVKMKRRHVQLDDRGVLVWSG